MNLLFAVPLSAKAGQPPSASNNQHLPAVKVVDIALNLSAVSVSLSTVVLFSCQSPPAGSQNLVQDTATVNFNQPANCFALSLGKIATPNHLAVQPLLGRQAVVVAMVSAGQTFLPFLSRGSSWPLEPSLPAAVAAALTLCAGVYLPRSRQKKIILSSPACSPLSLKLFLTLRC